MGLVIPMDQIDANTYKGNDIDTDGDGKVNSAVNADNVTGTYKSNDIDSNADGVVDSADEATNVTGSYKGNDIDTDGDGTVNEANNALTLQGESASAFANATHHTQHEASGSDAILLDGLSIKTAGDNLEFSTNASDQLTIHNATDSTDILTVDDNGNITTGNVNGVDVTGHASRHKNGGSDELDAAHLAGGLGSAGNYLRTDGSIASWGQISSYKGNDIDTNGDGKVDNADLLDGVELADVGWSNVSMATTDIAKSDVGLDAVPNTNIAYSSTIPADGFTSTEVTNLQAGTLANGTSPWTDIDLETSASASGTVAPGNCANILTMELLDGETMSFDYASFISADGTAIDQGCDLILATLDNAGGGTVQATILSADGSTVYDEETGNPLMNYSNTSGTAQTVMVGVDNGHFNAGSGTEQEVHVTIY